MKIPNRPRRRLFKNFTCAEPKMSKITKHLIKFVEQSGTKLASLFQKKIIPKRCNRQDCEECNVHTKNQLKGSSGCTKSSIVYRATFLECTIVEGDNNTNGA